MIFGDTVIVADKDGYSSIDYQSGDKTHPEYEYKMAFMHMTSTDVEAITICNIADNNMFMENIDHGNYKYYKSLFTKSPSTNRWIRAKIEMESLPANLHCISKCVGKMLAVRPSSISVGLREVHDDDIHGGEFYFRDKRETGSFRTDEQDDSLSLTIPLSSNIFSTIFNNIKSGDNNISISLQFPAYRDWLYGISGIGDPTYIIDTTGGSDSNFVIATSISSLTSHEHLSNKNTNDEEYLDDSEQGIIGNSDNNEDAKLAAIREIITSIISLSYTVKSALYGVFFCAAILILSFAFK
ncbi:hypothetical protein Q4R69_19520 [Morganella morganii subsp. sibonii]